VGAVIQDRAGKLWFGTSGRGASRYDPSAPPGAKAFTTFTENGGVTQNHIQSIYEDKAGNLWFGFSGGLFRFDGKSFINVTKDGPWK